MTVRRNCCEPTAFEVLLTKFAFRFSGTKIYAEFADRLPLNGDELVLDFGCGMGTVAYFAVKRLPKGQLICLDISERWLAACKKTLRGFSQVTYLHGGIEAMKGQKDQFDLIYCHFVLHDIPDGDLERVISGLASCLKTGGTFLFRDPLAQVQKLNRIKALAQQCGLVKKDSRITDVPLMGNTLENKYIKQ